MYFEADLKDKRYKVDVVETRGSWKVAIQDAGGAWTNYDIPKTDYRRTESYFSFLFKGVSHYPDRRCRKRYRIHSLHSKLFPHTENIQ